MLFNSYVFIFGFLPVALAVYQLASRLSGRGVVIWLGLASLGFYSYWKLAFLPILLASVLANYLFSLLISGTIGNKINRSLLTWLAVAMNLAALCYYKYLSAMLHFLTGLWHHPEFPSSISLPLGISFFTFTQIAYLIDLRQGAAEQQSFFDYLLFVTFFPHLIAGPILHHKDIIPQFRRSGERGLSWDDVAIGISMFSVGLVKKVSIADRISPAVNTIFSAHGALSPELAWLGALTYTMELYFDFSGYCDMALGLARMFSIKFPLNFSSPYKAASIVEFWQRWHMTLSQYITNYLYSPIQFRISAWRQDRGKKVSKKAQATAEGFIQMVALPTLLTMLIAGIWHGAGLQFIVFGLLHGMLMTIYHAWRLVRQRWNIAGWPGIWSHFARSGAVVLTFLSVMITFIFFRSANCQEAVLLLKRMAFIRPDPAVVMPSIVGGIQHQWIKVILALIAVWTLPNTQQIFARFEPAIKLAQTDVDQRFLLWRPSLPWAFVLSLVFMVAVVEMTDPSTFLYFQF